MRMSFLTITNDIKILATTLLQTKGGQQPELDAFLLQLPRDVYTMYKCRNFRVNRQQTIGFHSYLFEHMASPELVKRPYIKNYEYILFVIVRKDLLV